MMERLTTYKTECNREMICRYEDCDVCEEYCPHLQEDNCSCLKEILEKLGAYEDAEEQGLLLRLPCKVGTSIYMINHYWIDEGHICGIAEADDIDVFCYKVYCDPDDYTMVAIADFNETWFLTREEAEKALEDMKG